MNSSQSNIVSYYEQCLAEHGSGCKAVGWPNEEDAAKRYEVMIEVCRDWSQDFSMLDYGCGLGGLLSMFRDIGFDERLYTGYDASAKMIAECKRKFPDAKFTDSFGLIEASGPYNYVICNGVFTVKNTLSNDEALTYLADELKKIWPMVKTGLAFNVMSKQVEWEREDLLHVSKDGLCRWISDNLSRNIVIRQDYGLYEYTVYVYR